jgi:hypothetical protein
MAKKHKVDLQHPEKCVTLEDKLQFSLAVLARQEECAQSRKPTDLWGEPIWFDTQKYPWASATWAIEYANAEREKARLRRKFLRDER